MRSEEKYKATERAFRFPMLVLALVFAAILVYEFAVDLTPDQLHISEQAQLWIWLAFVIEFAVLLILAPCRRTFIRTHWFDLLTLLLPVLRFLRALWALRILALAGRASDDLRQRYGQRWMAILLALVLAYVGFWLLTRDKLPHEIRIATASEGSLYHKVGVDLAAIYTTQTGRPARVLVTGGSVQNQELLTSGGADVAIVQASEVRPDSVTPVAPLYMEAVHLIARAGSGIDEVEDLAGRRLAVGPPGSGTQATANQILQQYHLGAPEVDCVAEGYSALERNPDVDAALEVTGLINPGLHRLLSGGDFTLIPIEDGEAFAVAHPLFRPTSIPRGLYSERPPLPKESIETVGATAVLAVSKDAPTVLVTAMLKAVYEDDLQLKVTTLMPRHVAALWSDMGLHPTALRYFDPYGGIGILANFMESLAAIKELLLALGAGIYLLNKRNRQAQAGAEADEMKTQKERLDRLLEETMAIERAQIGLKDPDALTGYLSQVTMVKLRALSDLTSEGLRGDRQFSIFLMQCDNLSRKIQNKITQFTR